MCFTIDYIAYSFMEWCSDFSHTYDENWQTPPKVGRKIVDDLLQKLENADNKVELLNIESSEAIDQSKPIFSISNRNQRILTQLVIESDSNSSSYLNEIDKAYDELKEIALNRGKDENVDSLIIGLYFDISKRGILHDNEFFEIFNNLKVGCAIKRVK